MTAQECALALRDLSGTRAPKMGISYILIF
jgi:hypothetical protein